MALPTAGTKGWGAKAVTASTTIGSITPDGHRRRLYIKNTSANVAYVGGSDLTSANATTEGYPLAQNEVLTLTALEGGEVLDATIYYITASSTSTLTLLSGNE
jgi:hypothetical protein